MLAEPQVKRVLEQCTKVDDSYQLIPDFRDNDFYINIGWQQALRLVLEKNTGHISNAPLTDKREELK